MSCDATLTAQEVDEQFGFPESSPTHGQLKVIITSSSSIFLNEKKNHMASLKYHLIPVHHIFLHKKKKSHGQLRVSLPVHHNFSKLKKITWPA